MRHMEIKFIIDDPKMTDEQYESQEPKTARITTGDLLNILTYGIYNNPFKLPKGASIAEFESVNIIL